MRRTERALALRHALALGLAQGPTELLPVSSSAHTTLLARFAGWPYADLDGERRKAFEVALHAGAGLALAIDMRTELARAAGEIDERHAVALALALGPPALAGYLLQAPIERRLGGPRSIAAGLVVGAIAMALGDRRAVPSASAQRRCTDVGLGDGLALGLAQACALVPGVSRNGATLAAARARGFARTDAQRLSWLAALPVMLGASLLKGRRLAGDAGPRGIRAAAVLGGAAAFLSTLASARLLRRESLANRSLAPYALYRCLLAGLVVRRLLRPQ
ncbi:MAG TPA: undecaprenyl-diphosphate phosphatase [Solirubrobacteraceae bacterium]|nr:undecaprenyl-diphosphate phosphatase [Solirubrobacteraceae bacterium]